MDRVTSVRDTATTFQVEVAIANDSPHATVVIAYYDLECRGMSHTLRRWTIQRSRVCIECGTLFTCLLRVRVVQVGIRNWEKTVGQTPANRSVALGKPDALLP